MITVATKSSEVAIRLFSLDRSLRYEPLPVDLRSEKTTYKPRIAFAPRCAISIMCTKSLCHFGKCEYGQTLNAPNIPKHEFSRIPDTIDLLSGLQQFTVAGENGKLMYHYQKIMTTRIDNRRGPRRVREDDDSDDDDDDDVDEDEVLMKKYVDRKTGEINMDLIQPYIPEPNEIIESAWI